MLKVLKPEEHERELKSIEGIFPKDEMIKLKLN